MELYSVYENLGNRLMRRVNVFITQIRIGFSSMALWLTWLIILYWNAKNNTFLKLNFFLVGGGCWGCGIGWFTCLFQMIFSCYLVLGLLGIKADDISISEHWSSGALIWCVSDVKSLATFIISLVDDCSDD